MATDYILASELDNVAIVPRRLEPGTVLTIEGAEATLRWPVLQGHRICARPIVKGDSLLSWGLPFGTAIRDIAPGDYICNAKARNVLLLRNPGDYNETLLVNFEDRDTVTDRSLPEAPEYGRNRADITDAPGFPGFYRGTIRGWGTRNYLALIGVTSQARQAVLEAASRLQAEWPALGNFDGVVPVVHTEGGGHTLPNSRDRLVRTLAGMATNPNLGSAILVNANGSLIGFDEIRNAINARGLQPAEYDVFCHDTDQGIEELLSIGRVALARLTTARRQMAPISALRLGLQCGGSDAFSGVTANQVLGQMVHELIRRGGTANLAETDELIGAETHVLQRTAGPETFQAFLSAQQRFKDYAAAHGHTAEGNVSGGNLYRGLYNITLKSIGAGQKKDPRTWLDHVIEYGQPMHEPGYYFMDSPGNDLESIAGQVASGANMVLFTTGNGSITNFPFVPTIKIVTTTERYRLLETDMDFDAGQVLSGESFNAAAQRLYDLVVTTAGGARVKGEATGQYQTQIWRDAFFPSEISASQSLDGYPLLPAGDGTAIRAAATAAPQVALVLPTSLCSGQVAEQIAAHLNDGSGLPGTMSAVALAHTEGCGVSGGASEDIFRDTLIGSATHPLVGSCVFLEHGCEKTHNDYFRDAVKAAGVSPDDFDWASIQLEGGIRAVSRHVEDALIERQPRPVPQDAPVLVGLVSTAAQPDRQAADALGGLAKDLLAQGIGVVMSSVDTLLSSPAFLTALGLQQSKPNLSYAARPREAGLHVMDSSSSDWLEVATGLGAAHCRTLIVHSPDDPCQPHRFVPTLQIGVGNSAFDAELDTPRLALSQLVRHTLIGQHVPRQRPMPNVGFQISRGRFGVSL